MATINTIVNSVKTNAFSSMPRICEWYRGSIKEPLYNGESARADQKPNNCIPCQRATTFKLSLTRGFLIHIRYRFAILKN